MPPRHPRPARRGRGARWSIRDIALARLTGAPRPLPAPLDRGLGRAGARAPRPTGLPVTAEATPHHFTLTDATCAGYDPVFKVNPPLRTDGRRRRGQGRAGRRHHRRHRHRPRPARRRRPRSCRSTRRRRGCSASRPRWRSALTELDLPHRAPCSRCCPGSPAAHRRARADARRAASPRAIAAQPLRDRSRAATWTVDADRAREPQPQHALRRPQLTGRVRHTSSRRARRHRRRGAAMTPAARERAATRRHCSCSPTARRSRARRSAPTRRRRRDRRGRVQHRAVRLPGGHHRPVVRRADHHLHLPAHRQLRRQRRRRREPPRRSAAA